MAFGSDFRTWYSDIPELKKKGEDDGGEVLGLQNDAMQATELSFYYLFFQVNIYVENGARASRTLGSNHARTPFNSAYMQLIYRLRCMNPQLSCRQLTANKKASKYADKGQIDILAAGSLGKQIKTGQTSKHGLKQV